MEDKETIKGFSDEELKDELKIIIKELQNRNIKYCLSCGATDFFTDGCKECNKTLKECDL